MSGIKHIDVERMMFQAVNQQRGGVTKRSYSSQSGVDYFPISACPKDFYSSHNIAVYQWLQFPLN